MTFVNDSDTGTDPHKEDSDGDGDSDGMEIASNTDPNNSLVSPDLGPTSPSFGTFRIDFVVIGNPGNVDDNTGYGGLPYRYRMGVYEVSEDMITKANTAGSLGITKDNRGVNKPATSVSWNEAARFVNWLNTSQGHPAAYQFSTQPGDAGYDPNENITPWSSGEAWQLGGENLFRHKDAHYFLPSEDEWYKAAYYSTYGKYFDYATGFDSAPRAVDSGTAAGSAVFLLPEEPADTMDAGGLSRWGTMGQNGNVREWVESVLTPPNNSGEATRVIRGGSFLSWPFPPTSSERFGVFPLEENRAQGFRVAAAAVPKPFRIAGVFRDTAGKRVVDLGIQRRQDLCRGTVGQSH